METLEGDLQELPQPEPAESADAGIIYPPKYEKPDREDNPWIRSITSLALYLALGYYIFHSWEMLLLITGIVFFHELGHFMAMKVFRYNDLGIFFIPLLGAYVSGTKKDVSQRESAIILLAGPLPGIILGIILYLMYRYNPYLYLGNISYYTVSLSLIILNLVNLIPVYPLDGGQLLNRVFMDEDSVVSKVFVWLSIGFLIWLSLFGLRNAYPLLLFPLWMIYRFFNDNKVNHLEKKVQDAGLSLDRTWEELTDAEYWQIRTVLVREYAPLQGMQEGPPFEYDEKEERVMHLIRAILQRNLIQDLGWPGKLVVLGVWLLALASPWLIDLNLSVLRFLGN